MNDLWVCILLIFRTTEMVREGGNGRLLEYLRSSRHVTCLTITIPLSLYLAVCIVLTLSIYNSIERLQVAKHWVGGDSGIGVANHLATVVAPRDNSERGSAMNA